MKSGIKILLILCTVVSCFANIQFDIRSHIIHTEEDPVGDRARSKRIVNFDSNIQALWHSSPALQWYLKHRLDGSTRYMALPERIIPLLSHTAVGFQYNKNLLYHVGVTNDILGSSEIIRPYYFSTVDSTMTQKMLSGVNIRWEVDAKKIDFLADINYFRLNYDLGYDSNKVTKAIDNDMWMEMAFTFKPVESLRIGISSLVKTEFNGPGDFDYGDHTIVLRGDHTIKMKRARKLCIDWQAAGHYRISDALYHKGDAEGIAAVIGFNPILKLRNRMYLKGDITLDLSKKMQKCLYEFSIRKAWRSQTAIDLNYWTMRGTYFPRQGTGARFTLYLGRFGLIPDIRFYWRLNRDTEKFSYYRTTASFEMLFTIKRVDIFAGYTYSYFKDLKDYDPLASRGGVYFGVRKW